MTSIWRDSLIRSLDQALDLFSDAMRDCPDGLWESPMWPVPALDPNRPLLGPAGVLLTEPQERHALVQRHATPWGIAWHALEVFDYDLTSETAPWAPPAPFAGHPHWRDLTTLSAPWSRGEILAYAEYCRGRARETLAAMTAEQAAAPVPPSHRYAGQPRAWLIAGLVGHTTEHAAQVRQFITSAQNPPTLG